MAESQVPDRVNILVVDDLPSQRLTIEVSLAELGENVMCLPSGREALKFLLDNDAAVILLDVNMPGLDGFETATLIRQRPRTANTPIIFLTADPDEMQAARGYALGAVDYVISPFLPEVLRTKVKVFVTLSRANERLRREAEQRVELAREQTARATAEEQSRRLRVLVEAGGVLTRSLDGSGFELELLRLFVPLLADQAGIAFPENGPHRGPPTWIHAPNNGSEPLAASRAIPHELVAPVESVLTTGVAQTIPGSNGGGSAGIVMPLGVHGQLYGALAVARLGSGQPYSKEDVELLELIAGRTAVALENRRLYRELQERDRRKDEFLATLSHELRNPLGAITTAAQVLQMTVISDGPATHASQVIARQSLHLARIVDDLLEVSRVTAGRIRLSLQPLDLKDVVKRAVDAMRASGRLDPYQVVVTGESVMVEADLARVEQVITNLLVNAVKYTDPGGRIAVQIAAEDDRAVVRVSDTGIGISPELLPNLFEVFVQGRQALDRADGGLGIGLALVRKLIELQGGTVEALSPGAGQGSTFVVRLPRLRNTSERLMKEDANRKPGSALTVLVVDDNADVRDMLRTLLELGGHKIHEAANGPQAVQKAMDIDPHIALVDLGLPGFDGFEVARRLRKDPRTRGMLLVAVTGYGMADDQRKSSEAGFDAHVVKPVTPERLDEILALASRRASISAAREATAISDASGSTSKGSPSQ